MPEKYSALLRYLGVPPLLYAVSLHVRMKLPAFFASLSNLPSLQNLCCSALPNPPQWIGTMASADFCQFNRLSLYGLSLWEIHSSFRRCIWQTSTGKLVPFPPIYLLHLHHKPRIALDFVLPCKLVQLTYALYAVSVRQAGILPPASFRFHLTMDTLAFG